MATLSYLSSAEYLHHDTGAYHPETAERLRLLAQYLHQSGHSERLPQLTPRLASDEELLAVHTPRHLAQIHDIAHQGGGMIDADTVLSAASESVARLAAGGALVAVDAVLGSTPPLSQRVFVAARPPGHHAMAEQAMGFCLYNSVAVAARYAQRRYGLERILILDWDVHHGNGTQSIFYHDPSVLFISLHQYPLWPPGWGMWDQVGSGAGSGFTVNIPLPPGEGDTAYALACERIIKPIIDSFAPQLVLVSAGQDAHVADPISSMALTAHGFAALTDFICMQTAHAHAAGPIFLLEGGYNLHTFPSLVGTILDVASGIATRTDDPHAPLHPPAPSGEMLRRLDAVQETLQPWWIF